MHDTCGLYLVLYKVYVQQFSLYHKKSFAMQTPKIYNEAVTCLSHIFVTFIADTHLGYSDVHAKGVVTDC